MEESEGVGVGSDDVDCIRDYVCYQYPRLPSGRLLSAYAVASRIWQVVMFNAGRFVEFLKDLRKGGRGRGFLVVDGPSKLTRESRSEVCIWN